MLEVLPQIAGEASWLPKVTLVARRRHALVTGELIALLALLGGLAVVVALAYRAGARGAEADRKLAEAGEAQETAKEIEDHADRRAAIEAEAADLLARIASLPPGSRARAHLVRRLLLDRDPPADPGAPPETGGTP